MARMAKRRLLSNKRNPSSTLSLVTAASASTSPASGGRLNTHVLLALSFLVLSANAGPVESNMNEFNIGRLLSGELPSGLGLSNGGFGEQIAETVMRLFHLGEQTGVSEGLQTADTMIPSDPEEADYTALAPLDPLTSPAVDATSSEQLSASEKTTEFIHSLMDRNPALEIAMGVADLMHKMRELFVDIAVLEGEERGIIVEEEDEFLLEDAEGVEVEGSRLLPNNAEGVQEPLGLSVEAPVEDPLLFDFEESSDGMVDIPGQFSPPEKEETLAPSVPAQPNTLFNPYAAISLSAILATLFVVGVIVGRHYYLASKLEDADDMMERGVGDDSSSAPEQEKTSRTSDSGGNEEELNEKVGLELHPPSALNEESQEAAQALELLIDVAANALSSSSKATQPIDEKTPATPKMLSQALEVVRIKMVRDARTQRLLSSAPNSRPGTPILTFTPADSWHERSDSGDSSYESAIAASRATSPLPIGTSLNIEHSFPSRATTPTFGYHTAQVSPASSFATAHESSTPIHRSTTLARRSMEYSSIRRSFADPVERTFSPAPHMPGSLVLYDANTTSSMDNGEEVNVLGLMSGRGDGTGMGTMIPPAHITQTALDLALMLPATEWIFQFIVVFIGWFGFLMRPVPTRRG